MSFFNKSIQKKTYIQFWGGDYTRYASNHNIITKIEKLFSSYLVKHCAGIINLIDEEYGEFSTVFPKHNKHFVAPMTTSLRKISDYSKYIIVPHDKQELNIMVGNSATQTNHHVEIFELLKEMKPLNFHVYCPLSYGDKQYAETVTQQGKQYFGDHFHSLSDYLSAEDYLRFLEEMDIGIFNVNRQQAMGNINKMLYFGKKVYLNRECVLWQRYLKRGFIIHAIEELKYASSISRISDEEFYHNIKVHSPQDSIQLSIDSWNIVLKD